MEPCKQDVTMYCQWTGPLAVAVKSGRTRHSTVLWHAAQHGHYACTISKCLLLWCDPLADVDCGGGVCDDDSAGMRCKVAGDCDAAAGLTCDASKVCSIAPVFMP